MLEGWQTSRGASLEYTIALTLGHAVFRAWTSSKGSRHEHPPDEQAWRTTLATGAKFVLVAVCDTANDEGVCWPSVETIRRKCSMGERTVQRHLDDLESAGIITRSFRKGRSTTYQVHESKFPISTPPNWHPRKNDTPPNWHPANLAPTPPKTTVHPRQIRRKPRQIGTQNHQ